MNMNLSGKTVECSVCGGNTALEEDYENITSWLCVKCGYTTNSTFVGTSKELISTPKAILDMKHWDSERQIYWIPTVINMPTRGLIFPEKHGKKLMWVYVPMVSILEEDQRNYPIPGSTTEFYKRKLDSDETKRFTEFNDALVAIGAIIKLDELKENISEEKNNG